MGSRLLIRADGGAGIGSGHLGRCLALAEAWGARVGGVTDVTLVSSSSLPSLWRNRYEAVGVQIVDDRSSWLDMPAAWVVIDGYHFGALQEAVKSAGHRLLVIDDHASHGRYLADVVLDQNLDVSPGAYRQRPAGATLLLGPRYALVRSEFLKARRVRTAPAHPQRLLVALGGSPSPALRGVIDQALREPALAPLGVQRLEETKHVGESMAAADLALSAAGTTCWELSCVGVPAAVLATADNQVPVASALARRGVVEDFGWWANLDPGRAGRAIAALAADRERRQEMSQKGMALVDGRGARRVAARLRSALLSVRRVTEADSPLLWEWANDETTRRWAFTSDPISWETHEAWLAARLRDPTCGIYLASDPGGTRVGQTRFERDSQTATISVSVAADARGEGWGAAVIDAGVRQMFSESDVQRIVAQIKPGNAASIAAFENADFEFEDDRSGGGHSWVQYSRRRDAGAR